MFGQFGSRRHSLRLLSAIVAGALSAAVVPIGAPVAGAATFTTYTVNSFADTTDAAGSGLCATQPPTTPAPCTLRAAIAEANALSGVTINVPAGTYSLSAGALTISKPMTIVGAQRQPGAQATTVDGGAKDRVFNVTATGVTLDGIVVQNGATSKNNGGGVLVAKGAVLALTRSTIAANSASQGAGVEIDGTATITQSTISANTASGKGGGVFNAGTTTLSDSTVVGNAANGGGGIASSSTVNLAGATITGNTSNNSNGGGLYRVGGTFNVTSSIIAGNNASSGRDCYGSPTFTGVNVLQYTPGCNPSGGTILVVDPLLGALADNGGPTQTRRPLTGSAAIDAYALPCATAADQRAIARPQPTGGRCDVGAVEIAPLGLDLTLASSSETIGVGTATVPVGNISPSALLPTPSTGSNTFLQFSTIRHSTIRHSTIRHSTIRHSAIDYSTIRHSTIRHSDAEAVLRNAGIADPLATIALSDLTLDRPGGWDALLLGTQWENTPRESITLADVMPLVESAGVTLDQLDLSDTALGSVPYVSLLLGGVPVKTIPLSPALETGTDQQRLGAWCSAIRSATADPCAALNVDPNAATPSSITPLAFSYAGFSLDGISLNQILVKNVAANDAGWFQSMNLALFGLATTSLSTLPVSSLPTGWVDCTKVACATANLGQAAQIAGAIDPACTLYDLFTNATTKVLPKVAAFTIGDLLQGIIPPEEMPWQGLDLNATSLQNVASPTEPVLTYTMSLNVKGDRPAATSVQFMLPPGFVTVSGTFKIDGVVAPDPSVGAGNIASLALGTLAPGAHTATIGTRAGLTLGPATATAVGTATAGTNTVTASSSKTVTVIESFEQGGTAGCADLDACDTKTLQPDTLYLSHISTGSDRDLYRFTVPSIPGQKTAASILLSNLPIDEDLVLYGPPSARLRNTPTQSLQPVNDTQLSLYPTDAHLAPDTVNDVPLTPPAYAPTVVQVSANRGRVDERIETGTLVPGDYAVQVSGYNGASSPQPFSLRMSLVGTTPPPCAAPVVRPFADGGALANSTTLGSNPHVLILVPQRRLYRTYGAGRVDPLIAKVQSLATSVGATILAVDNPTTTAAAKYTAWDANRCSPDAANDVVREIGKQIDAARAANPAIDSIVLVGDDNMLPMARVPDRTRIANERGYADSVVSTSGGQSFDNELSSSLDDSFVLTDNAYGTSAGLSVNDHELFVPDVALGRLVETPEDASAAIDTFLINAGTLDPTTANSALVTGYDFMTDGAQGVADALGANGKTVDPLINNQWSGSDLTSKLLGGSAPGIVSFNGHFDQTRMLAGNGIDLVKSALLADPANANKLARRLLFSMGCHSGLSVSDVSIGAQLDWAQAITGAKQGGLYAGNTGFGYGDDTTVALSERLMGLYAQALDGRVSAGAALMIAKQQYAATTAVLNPYDEKVLQESTFYGLPIYGLASAVPASNTTLRTFAAAAAPTSANSSIAIAGTDPRTGLPVAPISVPLHEGTTGGPGVLHKVTTAKGSFYEVNGEKIMAEYRPIEPMTSLDITQANQRAHGVLITALATNDLSNFLPEYFRPNVDRSANEQLLTPIGDSVFPASLTRVTHPIGATGGRDLALLTAGQARDPKGDGTVTQRLFTNIGGVVEYSNPTDTDFTPPTIVRTRGEIVGTTAGFTVDTDGTARRAFVLYKAAGTNGVWSSVDLVATNLADGSKRWWGGGPIVGNDAEFFVQVLDASGNVAISNNKVSNFLASRLANNGGLGISLVPPTGVTAVNGWFPGQPVTALVSGGTGLTFSLDGADFASYPATGVAISGDGVHHLLARDATGSFAAADVSIDAAAPTVSADVQLGTAHAAPDATNHVWYDGPVALRITGDDGPVGSGVASIAYHAGNAPDTVATDASNPALARSPLGTASVDVPVGSSATYAYAASDTAGNKSAPGSSAVNIDVAAPIANCTVPDPTVWYQANVTVTCHPSDGGVGLLASADTTVTLSTTVPEGTQTSSASTGSNEVCDRLNHCITIGPFTFKVDEQAPTIAGTVQNPTSAAAQDGSGNTWYSGGVNLHLQGSDGPDGSGIASVTYASTGAVATATTTVAGAIADIGVNPSSGGSSNFTYSARDGVGMNSPNGSTSINVDVSAPVANCTVPSQTSWYQANVSVDCTATDNGVGLAATSPSMFTLTTTVAAGGQNSAAATTTQTVCDRLLHCATVGPFTFKVDGRAPVVTITSPTSGAVYAPGQSVAAAFSCSDGTGGSGIARCVGTVANGSAIDTTPGTHVFSVSSTDVAGNTTTASVTYSVAYRICLQYDPLKALPRTGTVPIKLQLCDASGNNLSSAAITLVAVYQDNPGQLPSPNFQGSSNTGYEFRFGSGSYIYNLDPNQPPALGIGTHTLYFVVKGTAAPVYAAPFTLK